MGQAIPAQKRLVLMSVYMMEPENYRPLNTTERSSWNEEDPIVGDWGSLYDPIRSHMDRAVLVDGLHNAIGTSQHRAGTSALSCVNPTNNKPESLGPAGAITIDQHIAKTLSAGAPRRSLNWGLSQDSIRGNSETRSGMFATGREQNIGHFTYAPRMLDEVFPDQSGGGPSGASQFTPIRDRLLADLSRLRTGLASEERSALDAFEANLVEYDSRLAALAGLSCNSVSSSAEWEMENQLESMMLQSALALQCGLTNVVAITIGTSNNHNLHMTPYQRMLDRSAYGEKAGFYSHGNGDVEVPGIGTVPLNQVRNETRFHWHSIHFEHLKTLINVLESATESDGSSIMDNTAIVYTTGNGHHVGGHHAGDNNKASFSM
ncbi:MAG: DUF1552 domain-containing protein, partial [Myxococcota bacterium]